MGGRISMKPLKEFALSKLPKNSPLRDTILGEKDYITPEEFLAKGEIWVRLIKYEKH